MYSTASTWRSIWAYCGKPMAHLWWTISQRTTMSRIGSASSDRRIKLFQFTDARQLPLAMLCNGRLSDRLNQVSMTLYTSSPLNTTCEVKKNPSEGESHKNGIAIKRVLPHPMASPINRKRQLASKHKKQTMLALSILIHVFDILAERFCWYAVCNLTQAMWYSGALPFRCPFLRPPLPKLCITKHTLCKCEDKYTYFMQCEWHATFHKKNWPGSQNIRPETNF